MMVSMICMLLPATALAARSALKWNTAIVGVDYQPVDFLRTGVNYTLKAQVCDSGLQNCDALSKQVMILGGSVSLRQYLCQVSVSTSPVSYNDSTFSFEASFSTEYEGKANFIISVDSVALDNQLQQTLIPVSFSSLGEVAVLPLESFDVSGFDLTDLACSDFMQSSPLWICTVSNILLITQNEFATTLVIDLQSMTGIAELADNTACQPRFGGDLLIWKAISYQGYILVHSSGGIFQLVSLPGDNVGRTQTGPGLL